MPTMTEPERGVTVGADTHADTHVGAVLDPLGRLLGTKEFPADLAGYEAFHAWSRSFGPITAAGIEGTGSWGSGLARHLAAVVRQLQGTGVAPATWDHFVRVVGRCADHGRPGVRGQGLVGSGGGGEGRFLSVSVAFALDDEFVGGGGVPVDSGLGEELIGHQSQPF